MSLPWRDDVEERVLERLRFQVAAPVAREQLLNGQFDVTTDYLRDALVVRLQAELLVDKVLEDEAEVPVTIRTDEVPRSALVELPRTWWQRLLRRPARSEWCPVVGNAVAGRGSGDVVTGTATVRAEYFRTFPENTVRYPDQFGPIRLLVRRSDYPVWRGLS